MGLQFVMADGSEAITEAAQQEFPGIRRLDCWWHARENIKRHKKLIEEKLPFDELFEKLKETGFNQTIEQFIQQLTPDIHELRDSERPFEIILQDFQSLHLSYSDAIFESAAPLMIKKWKYAGFWKFAEYCIPLTIHHLWRLWWQIWSSRVQAPKIFDFVYSSKTMINNVQFSAPN